MVSASSCKAAVSNSCRGCSGSSSMSSMANVSGSPGLISQSRSKRTGGLLRHNDARDVLDGRLDLCPCLARCRLLHFPQHEAIGLGLCNGRAFGDAGELVVGVHPDHETQMALEKPK